MKSKLLSLLISFGVLFLLVAAQDPKDNNPNGSSELSLLMRKMEKQLVDARPAVMTGTYKGTYPEEFDKVYTAKPTDDQTKNEYYDTFAGVYVQAVKSFTSAPAAEQVEKFNNVVNSCLACHSQHCPGPVSRIKKLTITK